VVSVCTFHAGAASNSIPETASFEGSLRYLDRPTGDRVESAVRCLVEDTARAAGVSAEFTADRRYEYPVVNHPELHALLRETVCESLSPERFHEVEEPTMGSEDFAYYTQARPGLMFWLYMGEKSPPLHSPHFDFNDEALRHGIVTLCRLAAVPPERLPASPDA
jgi:hippurate hydrolase